MRRLKDFEKVLIFLALYRGEGDLLLTAWPSQEALMTALCFDGDPERLKWAIARCVEHGFIKRKNEEEEPA